MTPTAREVADGVMAGHYDFWNDPISRDGQRRLVAIRDAIEAALDARAKAANEAAERSTEGWRRVAIDCLEHIVAMVEKGSAIETEAHVALIALRPIRALDTTEKTDG